MRAFGWAQESPGFIHDRRGIIRADFPAPAHEQIHQSDDVRKEYGKNAEAYRLSSGILIAHRGGCGSKKAKKAMM